LKPSRPQEPIDAANLVLIFDSIPGRNPFGGSECLPSPGRHQDGDTIGYLDGHAGWVSKTNLESLQWNPATQNEMKQ
jgi:hypothetical protein